jgi:hypothetical protein
VSSRDDEFGLVRKALDQAGLPSADFGRFTGNRHPSVIRPSSFDYRASVPVLLRLLPALSDPDVVESAVRSLTTAHARPAAAEELLRLFVATPPEHASLKWAIGNALSTVTTAQHKDSLLDLARDERHGIGRQMIVERLARFSRDERILDALRRLAVDEAVALHAMAGLRRRLGAAEALSFLTPLLDHPSEGVRRAAKIQTRKAEKAMVLQGRGD